MSACKSDAPTVSFLGGMGTYKVVVASAVVRGAIAEVVSPSQGSEEDVESALTATPCLARCWRGWSITPEKPSR